MTGPRIAFMGAGAIGSYLGAFMTRAGYAWSSAGENIAAGYPNAQSVVTAWLKSAGHCANIMNRSFTQAGLGQATGGRYGTYWTLDLARPR